MCASRNVLGIGIVLLAATGCPSGQPTPPPTPSATAAPKAPPKSTASASASAAASAPAPEPAAPLTTAPTVPSLEDAARSKLPDSLAEVKKAFEEKFYSQAADLLEAESKKKGATVDYEVLVYALLGHARNMTNEVPLAKSNYRRVLSKWGPFYKAGRKLSVGTPEEKHRYKLGLEAFGEALFFLAEQKRIKLDDVAAPLFDKEDTPAMVKMFADGKLAGYLARSENVIKKATKEYNKVLNLKPEAPQRWAVAAHSRIGAMYGVVAENVRDVNVKKENRGPIDEKAAAFLAKAKEAYNACSSTASGADATSFSKSCDAWLKANR